MKTEEINVTCFLELSGTNQKKVEHIYNIAGILHHNQRPIMSVKDFDYLYDKSVEDLQKLVGFTAFTIGHQERE